MSESAPAAEVVVPVKVPEPEGHAPPALAEPASGPAAEMSGAPPQDQAAPPPAAAEDKPIETSTDINGAPQPTEPAPEKPAEEKPADEKAAEASAADSDTEMRDAGPAQSAESTEPGPSAAAAASASNGTPASKTKRKSSTSVPEHKSKTLKKKQSKAKITHLDAKPGDYYLARLKSYPPWPSIICDEDMLPEVLLNTRPKTAIKADGTYHEDYADGGKKVSERTYPVMFLHTNEFGWIPNTDLNPLDPETCKDVAEKGKSKQLVEAYKVAAEGHDLEHFKEMLLAHEAAMQEDEARRVEREAQKAEKAEKKKKRKSDTKADDDVEMEDAEEAPKKSSKKRKKEAESDDEEPEKPPKTPKTTKLKLTTGKTPTTDKKTKEKPSKPKSAKKKKAQESEEEAEAEKEPAPPADPVQARKDREKEVLFLRHKLQKGFLSRDQEPSEDEMPQMATYIKKLEAYGSKLDVNIIRGTKINKVLKGIIKLNTIPKDEEYHFKERSIKLLGEWNQILGAEPLEADKPTKEDKASPTTTNGVHKEAEHNAEDKAEEKTEPAVEERKENALPAEEAAEKTSAEVPTDAGDKAAVTEEAQKDEKAAEEPKTEPAAEEKASESAPAAAGAD